jgi:hypothetical protein
MIGLSLSSVSEHNMGSCYDWVAVVVFCLLTQYLVVLWLGCRIVFTDGRQQQQPNHNTTTYYVYWRTTTTINPIIIKSHIVFTDGRQQRQPNHNITTCCVNRRKTTTYYDWVVVCCRPSVKTICGRIMIELSLSSVSKHNMWSYYD